jgi:opacity protein-like surface antigen
VNVASFRLAAAAACLALAVPSAAAQASSFYLRFGGGLDASEDTTLEDVDCGSTAPAALFGCGTGVDGRPIAARGDFGDTAVWEVGAGLDLGTRVRVELVAANRTDLDLAARANFARTPGEQGVHAEGRSLSLLLVGAVDLGPASWRVQPFVAAGAGIARNSIGPVRFTFPGLGADATTTTVDGTHTDFAWSGAVGAALRLSPSATLDLALRYVDLGEMRTDPGPAVIVRTRGTFVVPVASTAADLATRGVTLTLRARI